LKPLYFFQLDITVKYSPRKTYTDPNKTTLSIYSYLYRVIVIMRQQFAD
jgi:hypothetical protein